VGFSDKVFEKSSLKVKFLKPLKNIINTVDKADFKNFFTALQKNVNGMLLLTQESINNVHG
jgi:hypothetical protein